MWPLNGWLGRRPATGARSKPNDELLLDALSNNPDLFSLRFCWRANPESLRDMGVPGTGKWPEIGDIFGEGGAVIRLLLPVELVPGRCISEPRLWSLRAWRNAL